MVWRVTNKISLNMNTSCGSKPVYRCKCRKVKPSGKFQLFTDDSTTSRCAGADLHAIPKGIQTIISFCSPELYTKANKFSCFQHPYSNMAFQTLLRQTDRLKHIGAEWNLRIFLAEKEQHHDKNNKEKAKAHSDHYSLDLSSCWGKYNIKKAI